MPRADQNPADSPSPERTEALSGEDKLLARVKEVAQRIAERCRKALGDTKTDTPALPENPTSEVPPITGSG